MQDIAAKYNRPCTLTLEALQACGEIHSAHAKSKLSFGELGIHVKGLFVTQRLAVSTLLIWLSWTIIGLAYPLYFLFLPAYLSSRGAEFGSPGPNETWRNYAIVNIAVIFSAMFAAQMSDIKFFGRKYTMVFGALVTSKLTTVFCSTARCSMLEAKNFPIVGCFFGYTQIKSQAANIGVNIAISFFINVYVSPGPVNTRLFQCF